MRGSKYPHLSWVIVGCESGLKRRNQADYEFCARTAIEQCHEARVSLFHKQMPIGNGLLRVSHDPSEWPEWARVQQFPEVRP